MRHEREDALIRIVWEFVVKAADVERFEKAYGPDGDWARFFARHRGFIGTTLLQDTMNPRRFLTIDVWESVEDRARMLAAEGVEYGRLDATFEGWTESEREVGVFSESETGH